MIEAIDQLYRVLYNQKENNYGNNEKLCFRNLPELYEDLDNRSCFEEIRAIFTAHPTRLKIPKSDSIVVADIYSCNSKYSEIVGFDSDFYTRIWDRSSNDRNQIYFHLYKDDLISFCKLVYSQIEVFSERLKLIANKKIDENEIEKLEFNSKILKGIFDNANKKFLKKDKQLIEDNVSERSWYSRIAMYLENELRKEKYSEDYVVDIEYNRNMGKVKTTYNKGMTSDVIKITCDIIVHSRGKNKKQDNLICIEMKKSNRAQEDKDKDRNRLEVLTKISEETISKEDKNVKINCVCKYLLGIYYEVDIKKRKIFLEYYEKEECIRKEEIDIG